MLETRAFLTPFVVSRYCANRGDVCTKNQDCRSCRRCDDSGFTKRWCCDVHQKQTDELLEFDQDQHEREISFIPKQLANADDTAAAHFFYRQCQLLGVPLIIVNDEVGSSRVVQPLS